MYTLPPLFTFSSTEQDLPATLLRLILLCAGDIETNPGPRVYLCSVCSVRITRGTTSVLCGCCHEWVHLRCSGLASVGEYQSSFECPKCLSPPSCPPNNSSGPNPDLDPSPPQISLSVPTVCAVCSLEIKRHHKPVSCSRCARTSHATCSGARNAGKVAQVSR